MKAVTYEQLRLRWRFEILQLHDICFSNKVQEHGKLNFSCMVDEKQGLKIITGIGEHEPVALFNNETNDIYFQGLVCYADLKVVDNIHYLEIKAVSHTYLMDVEPKDRSFQDVNETYDSIFRKIVHPYPKGQYLGAGLLTAPIGKMIMQYIETDWEFLKRLASRLSLVLIPEMTGEHPRFSVGLPSGGVIPSREINYTLGIDLEGYREAVEEYGLTHLMEHDFYQCEFASVIPYKIGDRIEIEGQTYQVAHVEGAMRGGMLEFSYLAKRQKGIIQPLILNQNLVGAAMEGGIIDVANNVVKIHLDIDETQSVATAMWFAFNAEGSNVFHFMPELGSRVKLYFPSNDESEAMTIQSVRVSPSSPEAAARAKQGMSNPGVKSFGTDAGKCFDLGNDDINFVANGGLFLSLDDGDGVTIVSDSDIIINGEDSIALSAQEILVSADDSVILQAQDTSYVILKTDTQLYSTEIFMEASSSSAIEPKDNPDATASQAAAEEAREAQRLAEEQARLEAEAAAQAEEEAANRGFFGRLSDRVNNLPFIDAIQTGLGFVSMIPVLGTKVSVVNAGISLLRGDLAGAGMNLLGAIPGVSKAMKGIRAARKAKGLIAAGRVASSANRVRSVANVVNSSRAVIQTVATVFGRVITNARVVRNALAAARSAMRGLRSAMRSMRNRINSARETIRERLNKARNRLRDLLRRCKNDPVDVVTGVMLYEHTDFSYPGVIPLEWKWVWESNATDVGSLGHGVMFEYDTYIELVEEENALIVILPDGRAIIFPELVDGDKYYDKKERYWLSLNQGEYTLYDTSSGLTYHYQQRQKNQLEFHLVKISNETAYTIDFTYDSQDLLTHINDSANRDFSVVHYPSGLIKEVFFEGKNRKKLVTYEYNEEEDLISFTDALDQSVKFKYKDHLIIQRVDKDGWSFYWRYEGKGEEAKVVHTWSDTGVMEGWFTYYDGYTKARNTVGAITEYHYDENSLIHKIVHPNGGIETYEYDEDWRVTTHTNVLGHATRYEYDQFGFESAIINHDGTVNSFTYNESGKRLEHTNPLGEKLVNEYNEKNQLIQTLSSDEIMQTIHYSEDGLLSEVENPLGDKIQLSYDSQNNLQAITMPDGSNGSWEYDEEGNSISSTNALGSKETFRYDELQRLVEANTGDGNNITYGYDEYDNVLRVKDKQTEINYAYTLLGSLASISQDGKETRYRYNKEEELVEVTNEAKDKYILERDKEGNVIKETFFNGMERSYIRDIGGRVTEIRRPEERWTKFSYNEKNGLLKQVDYSDETWAKYEYDKLCRPIKLQNEATTLSCTYDKWGGVTSEERDGYKVTSQYDVLGRRTHIESSLGADITQTFNSMDNITKITASKGQQSIWEMALNHNQLGQEVERILPSNLVSSRHYDTIGRPTEETVKSGSRRTRQKAYAWDINYQLRQVTNQLHNQKVGFKYDQLGSLIRASYQEPREEIVRQPDKTNNYYEQSDTSDRKYGKNGELFHKEGGILERQKARATYEYDKEGNLTRKESNNQVWSYKYASNGMMSEVTLPDGSKVEFTYDPLGRRIKKTTNEKEVHFLWDGDTILHEWEEDKGQGTNEQETNKREANKQSIADSLITWVFEDGSFTPSAKITPQGTYSIISNYLGVPEQAYDSDGKLVWEMELDSYGRVKYCKEFKNGWGETIRLQEGRDFIPFRFPGQYEDSCTGLYYNRFRYYDPEMGQYTQVDPIGLAGGNPTLYGYVHNPFFEVDILGLAPRPNNGIGPQHGSDIHNSAIDDFIEWLKNDPSISDIRKNQQQVDVNGNTVGRNRPDVQYNKGGVHHNVEFDTTTRGSSRHQQRIPANDPSARNTYHVIDKETGRTVSTETQQPKRTQSPNAKPCG